MSDPFMAELRMMSFNWAPKSWAKCDGQLMPINQNQALFSLLGTAWGGNGTTNFALPDLRGRTALHVGGGRTLGVRGGEEAHTLTASEMPAHTHFAQGSGTDGNTNLPGGNVLASAANVYGPPNALTAVESSTVANVGGSQAHTNMQPYLSLTFCIALQGIFPSRN